MASLPYPILMSVHKDPSCQTNPGSLSIWGTGLGARSQPAWAEEFLKDWQEQPLLVLFTEGPSLVLPSVLRIGGRKSLESLLRGSRLHPTPSL